MTLADAKPILVVVGILASALAGGQFGTQKERAQGEARARVAKQECDSTVRAVEAQRVIAVTRVDSLLRVVEVRQARAAAYASTRSRSDGGCKCAAGGHGHEKQSFLSRWGPPGLGLAAGILIGRSWAPDAAATIVNVVGSGGGGPRKHGHYHGAKWFPKWCRDARWHGRGKHRGHGRGGHDKD